MNKKDLRVIKTRNALYNTLLELMTENGFEDIKVSDICNKALINRSTFYSHYNDKYELLKDAIEDIKNALTIELSKNNNITNTKEYYLEMIKLLLNKVDEKRDIFYGIMINNRNSIMVDIIYDVLDNSVFSRIKNENNIEENTVTEIVTKFYLGGVFNVVIEWLKNSHLYTKEDIINYLEVLIPNNLY